MTPRTTLVKTLIITCVPIPIVLIVTFVPPPLDSPSNRCKRTCLTGLSGLHISSTTAKTLTRSGSRSLGRSPRMQRVGETGSLGVKQALLRPRAGTGNGFAKKRLNNHWKLPPRPLPLHTDRRLADKPESSTVANVVVRRSICVDGALSHDPSSSNSHPRRVLIDDQASWA